MNAHTKSGNGRSRIDLSRKPHKRRRGGQFGRSSRANIIDWSHSDFGTVQIELQHLGFDENTWQVGPNTWQKIDLNGQRPDRILLDFSYKLNPDVKILYGLGNKVIDVSDPAAGYPGPFISRIKWESGRRQDDDPKPNTIEDAEEDFQLILMNRQGLSLTLDVGVQVRKGMFYVTLQEVYGVQIVKHPLTDEITGIDGLTSVAFGGYGLTMVPKYTENCYPGSDPVASMNRSYPERADKVLGYADQFGIAAPVEDCEPGDWDPEWPAMIPDALAKDGFTKAVVMWFNLTVGFGFLQLEDGRSCFVHFNAIENEAGQSVGNLGEFPALQPGKGCYVKWQLKEDRQGKKGPAALKVRPAYA